MTNNSLKSTTAILTIMSLLQPGPLLAQSNSNANENAAGAEALTEIIAETDALADAVTTRIQAEVDAAAVALAAEGEAARVQAAADAQAETDAAAKAAALAAAEAEALKAEAEAARVKATADAQAETDAAAKATALATAEAEALKAEAEAARVQAAADAQAETDAAAKAAAVAQADAAAAAAAAEAQAVGDAAAEAEAVAQAKAEAAAVAAEEAAALAAADAKASEEQKTESATPDQGVIETLTGAPLEALATAADTETPGDVTTETVTEQTSRASSEEFEEWRPENQGGTTTQQSVAQNSKSRNGMSDLQKAGLVALGAVVVGAILLNGQRVAANTGDRVVVVDDDNDYRILKDDDALLRQPGSEVRTQRFSDGSTRTNVLRSDGTEIVTIRDSDGRVLRRVLIETDGREYVLFDDTQTFAPVVVRDLPKPAVDTFDYQAASDGESLRAALLAADRRDIGRSFSLQQVRDISEVRQLSPEINLRNVTFATASSAIQPSQAEQLRQMGMLMRDIIAEDPTELFLIEGYTDAIGEPGYNLLLSDRRAESVALAFNEYFDVPTENMVVQGYGERFLKIRTQQAERVNRRVAVRRITTLMRQSGQ
ncbi:outer membrane protein OmpA-like peptidoglycan-associated protein [Roseovarius sp. MBR-79]